MRQKNARLLYKKEAKHMSLMSDIPQYIPDYWEPIWIYDVEGRTICRGDKIGKRKRKATGWKDWHSNAVIVDWVVTTKKIWWNIGYSDEWHIMKSYRERPAIEKKCSPELQKAYYNTPFLVVSGWTLKDNNLYKPDWEIAATWYKEIKETLELFKEYAPDINSYTLTS